MSYFDNSIVIHILSFTHSFYFYKTTKSEILWRNYFGFKREQTVTFSLVREYVLLEYFLYHRHLLLLDEWKPFRKQFDEHYRDLCRPNFNNNSNSNNNSNNNSNSNNKITNVKNIARLTYFISCLRRIEFHQRRNTSDKMEQTNIGICFNILIKSVSKQSEIELEMARDL